MYPLELLKRHSFYIKPTVRLCLIAVFIGSTVSITVSWTSVISLILLLVSYIFFSGKGDKNCDGEIYKDTMDVLNPFKGKIGRSHLTQEMKIQIASVIEEFVVDDAENAPCLKRFEILKARTDCIFAKKAKLWGCSDYDESVSIEENMRRIYPTMLKFTLACMDLGLGAFLVELPGSLFGNGIKDFAVAVKKTLLTFKLEDLKRIKKKRLRNNLMKESSKMKHDSPSLSPKGQFHVTENTKLWGKKSWVFEINQVTFFITSFAPFYPETNSRHSFGCEDCYILFQPEMSFAIHDLPPDTAHTNWVCPLTVRDKIRVAFNNAGRYYMPPLQQDEPMVFDIVKQISPEDEVFRWWDLDSNEMEKS